MKDDPSAGHSNKRTNRRNDWGRVEHQWNRNELNADVDYGQWQPYGTKSGSTSTSYSISVSVGYQAAYATAGISWSYSQPNVEVVDESSPDREFNQWHLKVNADWGDDTRTNFIGFKPSSVVTMDNREPSMGGKEICELQVSGRFDNGVDHYQRLYSGWYKPMLVPA